MHYVANALGIASATQKLAARRCPKCGRNYHTAYLPFLNPIKEVFGWLKRRVRQGQPNDA